MKKSDSEKKLNCRSKNKYSGVTPEFEQWLNQTVKKEKRIIKELAKR